jgi:hypothetical protein
MDYLKLNKIFNQTLLKKDLNYCLNENWKEHYNNEDYKGSWSIIGLRTISGSAQDILAFNTDGTYKNSDLLNHCDYFKEVLDFFQCEKESVRIMNLKSKSEIKEHVDYQLSYASGVCRLHIPIQTNSLVKFIVNNQHIPMKEGECWYANFELPHSVVNDGSEDRIHLVIDCIRNTWTDSFFTDSGGVLNELTSKEVKKPSKEESKKIYEELIQMNTDISLKMARDILKQLEKEN